MYKTFMLEYKMLFLAEQRTESYKRYGEGASGSENAVLCQELLGATSYAGWQEPAA